MRIYDYALNSSEVLALFNSVGNICGGADTSGNGIIEIGELINYIERWKAGSAGISEVMVAIGEWKDGC